MAKRSRLAGRVEAKPADQYHHRRLRLALVDAALALVGSDGVEALSLRAVARRVGVTASAAYTYFRDRAALLAAHDDAFGVLLGAIQEAQRAGIVQGGEPRRLAVAAWAAVHGLAWLIVDGQVASSRLDGDAAQSARNVLRVLFKGLEARR